MAKLVTLKIPRYVLISLGILGGAAVLCGGVVFLFHGYNGGNVAEKITKYAQPRAT